MKMRLPTIVAVLFGAITLIAYFIPIFPLTEVKKLMIDWASVISAFALLLGIANLLLVHIEKFSSFKPGWVYSIVLLLGFIFVVGMGMFAAYLPAPAAASTFNAPETMRSMTRFLFLYVQTPIESALTAMLAIIMVLAGARLVRKRRKWSAAIFVVVSILLIIGLAPLDSMRDLLGGMRDWIVQVPALAGARGILLGIALGAITTGMRIIIGVDRPYGE